MKTTSECDLNIEVPHCNLKETEMKGIKEESMTETDDQVNIKSDGIRFYNTYTSYNLIII